MTRRTLDPRYHWIDSSTGWLLMWDISVIGKVDNTGAWRVDWRGHRHGGQMRSPAQARRFMERWLAARRPLPPRCKRQKRSEVRHISKVLERRLQLHCLPPHERTEELAF